MTINKRSLALTVAIGGLLAVAGAMTFLNAYEEIDRQVVEDWGAADPIVRRPIDLGTAILMERSRNADPLVTINVAVGDLRGEREHAIRRIAARVSEAPGTTVGLPTTDEVLVVIPDTWFECLGQIDDRTGADREQAIAWTRTTTQPQCWPAAWTRTTIPPQREPVADERAGADTPVRIRIRIRAYTATKVHTGLQRRQLIGYAMIIVGGFVITMPVLWLAAASRSRRRRPLPRAGQAA